ncbi:MAG: type VI secretion system tip protein TssI/VgrG [Planctomycetota bacterium]
MPESMTRDADTADFTLKVGELTTEDLRVTRFEGSEGISELFCFRLELCSNQNDIDFVAIVGKPCVLEIGGASGSRFVNGIARLFERIGEGESLTYYAIEIVPVHWLLTKRWRSRVFLESNCNDMTIPGIIKKVLTDAGIPEDSFRSALQHSGYQKHEFVAQYRESEMNFISRLMESEGIFYFFEHEVDGHKMVIADSGVAHVDTPNDSEFIFRSRTGMVTEEEQEWVCHLRASEEVRTGATALDEFDFQKPPTQLRSDLAADEFTSLQMVDYPGKYIERDIGKYLTQVRLEEFQCARRVMRMEATIRNLLPGFKFSLQEHSNETYNREYLVTHLRHHATPASGADPDPQGTTSIHYNVDIRCIPSDIPYRAPRVTPRPTVTGSQTAIVVGPSGEEIYTDKYGRVKVQFHWDQEGVYDENSSFWVRVSQGSAGGQYGIMFLPRVGQEVIIDYLEGDPDRPIVTGRVYNADQMPPYTLPDEKTKSVIKTHSSKGGGGTNELCFEDAKDSEQIFLYAQKDQHIRVNADRVENIGNNRHLTVKKDKFELVKENKHAKVTLDYNEEVGGKHSLKIVGDVAEDFGANQSIKVATNYYLNAGSEIVIEAGSAITLKVGGNFVKIDSSGVTILGTQVKINSGGSSGSGSAIALKEPEAPIDARSTEPGQDTTYQAEPTEPEPLEPEEGEFTPVEIPEREETVTSWVEIEMVDDAGQPWPNEYYEATLPDGKIRKGRLDKEGRARIPLPEPVDVQISFPRLDAEAWERA